MATYAEMVATILGDLHRTDITAEVETAMANALVKLRMDRYWFNEEQASFTVTLTSDYALTTVLPTMLEIDAVRVWQNGTPIEMDRAHWADLNTLDETLVNGTPAHWAVHHQTLRIYPTPNATLTVEAVGLKELSLTAWCSYAPTLVRATAEIELFGLVTHDIENATKAAEFARAEKESLLRRSPTFASSGEVRPYL